MTGAAPAWGTTQRTSDPTFPCAEWRGKIQLRLCVTAADDPGVIKDAAQPLPERLLKRALRPWPPEPPTRRYELRAAVLMGADLGGLSDDDEPIAGGDASQTRPGAAHNSRPITALLTPPPPPPFPLSP